MQVSDRRGEDVGAGPVRSAIIFHGEVQLCIMKSGALRREETVKANATREPFDACAALIGTVMLGAGILGAGILGPSILGACMLGDSIGGA